MIGGPVDAGNDPETLRLHTLKIGAELRDQAAVRPDPAAPSITVTLDSTFIRSCEDGERHLEARVGNVCADVLKINRPDDLGDIANLGLTLAEGKLLLAGLQQEIVAAQAKGHAVRRPDCRSCGEVCRVKDYRDHAVATLFGQVTVRLPRFRCAGCGGNEAGNICRSTSAATR